MDSALSIILWSVTPLRSVSSESRTVLDTSSVDQYMDDPLEALRYHCRGRVVALASR